MVGSIKGLRMFIPAKKRFENEFCLLKSLWEWTDTFSPAYGGKPDSRIIVLVRSKTLKVENLWFVFSFFLMFNIMDLPSV